MPTIDEFEEIAEAPGGAGPNISEFEEAPSTIESVLRGAAQGVSLGFSDEITAGLEALFSGKTYEEAVEESRNAYRAAEQANPGAYIAGDVGGSLATALVPGAGALGAARLGKVGAAVAKGMATGAASGFGRGEGLEGSIGSAGMGAAVGGVLPAGLGLAGKGIKALKESAESIAAHTTGQTAETAKHILSRGMPVAKTNMQVAGDLRKAVKTLDDDVAKLSDDVLQPAIDDLPTNFSKADALSDLDDVVAKRWGRVTGERKKAYDKARGIIEDGFKDLGDGENVDARGLRTIVSELQSMAGFDKNPTREIQKLSRMVQLPLRQKVKKALLEVGEEGAAEASEEIAEKLKVVEGLKGKLGDPKTAKGLQKGAQYVKRLKSELRSGLADTEEGDILMGELRRLDDLIGGDTAELLKDQAIRKALAVAGPGGEEVQVVRGALKPFAKGALEFAHEFGESFPAPAKAIARGVYKPVAGLTRKAADYTSPLNRQQVLIDFVRQMQDPGYRSSRAGRKGE